MCIPDSVKVMTSVGKPSASLFATLGLFLCTGGVCFELALIYSSVLGCPKFGESEEVAKKFLVVWETKLYLKLICVSLSSLLEKSTTGCRPDQNLASFHRPALHLIEDTGGRKVAQWCAHDDRVSENPEARLSCWWSLATHLSTHSPLLSWCARVWIQLLACFRQVLGLWAWQLTFSCCVDGIGLSLYLHPMHEG